MSNYFKHKFRSKSPGKIIGMILFGIIAGTGLAILFGYVIMWLWNWLMPMIFGLTTLTFWQAAGLFILAKILLGGCGNFGDSGKKSSKSSHKDKECQAEFSKWKHYDQYWEEEGNQAYEAYIARKKNENNQDQ